MKTIIKKDFYAIRVQLISSVVISIMMYLFIFLFSDLCEANSSNKILPGSVAATFMLSIFSLVSILCFSTIIVNTIIEDKNCNFLKFYRTTPIGDRSYSKAKIISSLMLIATFTSVSLIAFVPASVFMGVDILAAILIPVLIGLAATIITMPTIPLTLKSGKTATILHIILMLAVIIGGAVFATIILSYNIPLHIILICAVGIAAIAALSTVVSYLVAKKLEKDIDKMID